MRSKLKLKFFIDYHWPLFFQADSFLCGLASLEADVGPEKVLTHPESVLSVVHLIEADS